MWVRKSKKKDIKEERSPFVGGTRYEIKVKNRSRTFQANFEYRGKDFFFFSNSNKGLIISAKELQWASELNMEIKSNSRVELIAIGRHKFSVYLPREATVDKMDLSYSLPGVARTINIKGTFSSTGFDKLDSFVKSFNVCFGI